MECIPEADLEHVICQWRIYGGGCGGYPPPKFKPQKLMCISKGEFRERFSQKKVLHNFLL